LNNAHQHLVDGEALTAAAVKAAHGLENLTILVIVEASGAVFGVDMRTSLSLSLQTLLSQVRKGQRNFFS
jgi:hypothetical protein